MSEVKNCPKCGGEIEEGFLIASRPLFWDTKKHLLFAAGAGAEQLMDFALTVLNIEARRCKKCNLVIFQYTRPT